MIYQSPLHIIPNSVEFDGSEKQLKRLRKELLLRFDINNSTTINIEGKDFDKQSIIQHINALAQESEFHLKIYRHSNLWNFLERQDLAFFKTVNDWEILADTAFKNQLQPYFTAAYSSKKLKAILAQKVAQPENELYALLENSFRLPESYEVGAYTESLVYLRQLIIEGEAKYKACYLKGGRQVLKSLDPFFKKSHLTAFLLLPSHFELLRHKYVQLAGKIVNYYADAYSSLLRTPYEEVLLMHQAASVIYKLTGKYKEGYLALRKHVVVSSPEAIRKRAPWYILMGLSPVIFFGCLYLYTGYKVETWRTEKKERLVGSWKTKMTALNGTLEIDRYLKFQSDGTGQTQLILNPQSVNECNLFASFKWTLKERVLYYNYQSDFKNSCDTLSKNYNWLDIQHLIFVLNSEKFNKVTNSQLTTVLYNNTMMFHPAYSTYFKTNFPNNSSMGKKYEAFLETLATAYKSNEDSLRADGNYTLLNGIGYGGPIFRVDSKIDTQTFHFEKVDSSAKAIEALTEIQSIDIE